MRIAIDTTALPPNPVGAGKYIIELVREFSRLEREFELVIFAQEHGRKLIDSPNLDGLEWIMLPDRSPAKRLLWEQTTFPRSLRQAKIDLLHSPHYTRPVFLPCKSIVSFHDLTFFLYPELHTRSKRIFFPMMMRYSARAADLLIASSQSTRQDAIRILHIPPEKIVTVPLGVAPDFRPVHDPEQLQAIREKYHLPEDFILYVGLVEPRKNLPMLIRAYARLLHDGPPRPLVIVGRMGWMYSEVLEQIESLGLKEQVHFTGYVPLEDLPMVYNLAQVFVYPSTYEGFGFPPLEALACGTPVITTRVSSIPEHVGEAGILIPPQDEDALVEALRLTLLHPELRQELSERGPIQAAKFTWRRTAQETLRLYQQVLQC